MACTGSVGCAPTPSQYWTRSEFTSMKLGFSFGWYLPISSIARPLRLFLASATMMRYCGERTLPSRFSLILTATVVESPQRIRGVIDELREWGVTRRRSGWTRQQEGEGPPAPVQRTSVQGDRS